MKGQAEFISASLKILKQIQDDELRKSLKNKKNEKYCSNRSRNHGKWNCTYLCAKRL